MDRNQLQQVLLNLTLNACEAMPDGGTLLVSSATADGRVVIHITDTGCGIERKDLDRIFEPFFTTKPAGKGTGLGLSVSYGILQQHGGTLKVDSDPGKGTTFTITLPAVADDFDLVIAVLSSPEPEPIAVVRQLKAEDNSTCVIVVSRNQMVQTAIGAIREGAADYLVEPCSADELRAAVDRVKPAGTTALRESGSHGRSRLPRFERMLGRCSAMLDVFELIERIATAEATVLVTGESGTGKELAVRAIHRLSHRCDAPLLGCDCTALAPTLLESELFGHVKGSFSGAIATKKGSFEAADHGTLLLDEVSNLSMETQGKLLRVLETRCIRRVGDTAEREVDIRLIATTNRDLGQMVKVGQFRADLYYRLNVVPVSLPALRDRAGDIPLLAMAFLDEFSRQMGLHSTFLSPRALQQMEVYQWPGNVRELRNIVQRLAVLYGGSQIELEHLPLEIRKSKHTLSSTDLPRTWDEFKTFKRQVVEDLERRFLTAALGRCAQNVTHASESVGMQRPNFHALLRHHGLKPGATERD